MGMDLVPVYEDEASSEGMVTVNGSVLQSMNVKMEVVKTKDISLDVTTYGTLTTNERKEVYINSKFAGWIEKLYVNETGVKIRKGEKLAEVYSPEVFAAEQEVLTALKFNSGSNGNSSAALNNGLKKLRLLEVPEAEITRLLNQKTVNRLITLTSPISGTVLHKNVLEGERFTPNKPLFRIADLSELWLLADIYEEDLLKISKGDLAKASFTFNPSKDYEGRVSFIYPTINSKTRTAKVRIVLKNSNDELKPEMFANVTIYGNKINNAIVIPENAVIRSGKHNTVIVSLGEGKFKPVEVKLGIYSDGFYQVLSGLKANTMIVSSGQFMIDSESNLKAALKLFSSPKNVNGKSDTTMNMKSSGKKAEAQMNMDMSKNKAGNNPQTEAHTHEASEESLVRTGVIDVKSIDKNGDGFVYQDFMDWNVISDKDGRCPVCGMYLQKVSIKEAEKNLTEHGFKHK
jgi:multidrug efflux pump subunit AcrA (membrane-fusion protein)